MFPPEVGRSTERERGVPWGGFDGRWIHGCLEVTKWETEIEMSMKGRVFTLVGWFWAGCLGSGLWWKEQERRIWGSLWDIGKVTFHLPASISQPLK